MEIQGTQKNKNNLEKRRKMLEDLYLQIWNFTAKPVMKAVWYHNKDKLTDQQNQNESLEIHAYRQLIFYKDARKMKC
jgi:hypothetical protein